MSLQAGMGTGFVVLLEQESGRCPERESTEGGALGFESFASAHYSLQRKTPNAASSVNLKPCSEWTPRLRLSWKEALPLWIGTSSLTGWLHLMAGAEIGRSYDWTCWAACSQCLSPPLSSFSTLSLWFPKRPWIYRALNNRDAQIRSDITKPRKKTRLFIHNRIDVIRDLRRLPQFLCQSRRFSTITRAVGHPASS